MFSQTLTLIAGQVQAMQACGEGSLQTTVERERALQVLRLL